MILVMGIIENGEISNRDNRSIKIIEIYRIFKTCIRIKLVTTLI